MKNEIKRIRFYESNAICGEFVPTSNIFNHENETVNKHRVRRIRNAIAENFNVPPDNIKCMVYDQKDELMYRF